MGKSHAEAGERKEQNPTVKNRRKDEFRQHSLRGRPQCRHCRKSFYGWPQFMGHFSQKACPILHHAPAPASSPAPTNPPGVANCLVEPLGEQPPVSSAQGVPAPGGEFSEQPATRPQTEIPLLYRPELQQLATRHTLRQLAAEICRTNTLHHCPECFQYCVRPSYVARHAVKMHTNISVHQTRVLAWIKQRARASGVVSGYSTPPRAHIRACPVLWVCGQFLARFDSLEDRGQSLLDGFRCDGRAPECLPGVGAVLGNDGPEQALTLTGSPVHEATVHSGPGGGGAGTGGDGLRPREGEEGTRVSRAGRDGAQVRQGRHQGPRQPKLSDCQQPRPQRLPPARPQPRAPPATTEAEPTTRTGGEEAATVARTGLARMAGTTSGRPGGTTIDATTAATTDGAIARPKTLACASCCLQWRGSSYASKMRSQ